MKDCFRGMIRVSTLSDCGHSTGECVVMVVSLLGVPALADVLQPGVVGWRLPWYVRNIARTDK